MFLLASCKIKASLLVGNTCAACRKAPTRRLNIYTHISTGVAVNDEPRMRGPHAVIGTYTGLHPKKR